LRLPAGVGGLDHDSDVLVTQIIAVPNESFRKGLGGIPEELMAALCERVRSVMGL